MVLRLSRPTWPPRISQGWYVGSLWLRAPRDTAKYGLCVLREPTAHSPQWRLRRQAWPSLAYTGCACAVASVRPCPVTPVLSLCRTTEARNHSLGLNSHCTLPPPHGFVSARQPLQIKRSIPQSLNSSPTNNNFHHPSSPTPRTPPAHHSNLRPTRSLCSRTPFAAPTTLTGELTPCHDLS